MANYTITYNANGGTGTIASQTKASGATVKLAVVGFSRTDYTLDGWATSASGGVAYALGANYSKDANLNLYAHWKVDLPDPVLGSVTRVSDKEIRLTWDASELAERIYIYRYTDDGSSAKTVYVSGTATSYTDTTTSANHKYSYVLRAWNSTGYSSKSYFNSVYTTPAAPASVTGSRTGAQGTDALLTVANSNTRTATGFEVEMRAEDSATWSTAYPTSSTGTPVTSILLSAVTVNTYFRVRNTRGSLKSAWTESNLVVPVQPPMAPTLVNPSSGSVVAAPTLPHSVTFQWLHNSIDGSAQTAAEVQYKRVIDQNWTTVSVTTEQEKAVSLNNWYAWQWRVRTKGLDEGWGEWSEVNGFNLLTPPTIAIVEPSATVDAMPITYKISYEGDTYVFASGTLTVKLDGETVYSEPLPYVETDPTDTNYIEGTITTAEWIPDNDTYTFEFKVRSSSTLEATCVGTVDIELGGPYPGILDTTNHADTGYCDLEVGWRHDSGTMEPTYITLSRIVDGERTVLADNMDDGDNFQDRYAPLNKEYTYELVTHDETGAIMVTTFPNVIETQRWFVYWGGNIAWAEWNPEGSYRYKRPQKTRVHYVGREYPVSYDGTALDEEHEIVFTVLDRHGWSNNFVQLMHDGGRGIYKSVDGKVFWADFELENVPNYTSITKIGTVSLTITRIDGDPL